MSRLILLMGEPVLMEGEVPVHVDDQHIEWNVILAESAHQVFEFLIAVCPIARPPRAKGKSRRQRNTSGNSREVCKRVFVVVAVAEEIPVLAISSRALHHPGPRTVFPFQEAKIIRVEEWARGIVHQHPTIARDE